MWRCWRKSYSFRKEIGRGSYGLVFEAIGTEGVFAIKQTWPRNESDKTRCIREIQILQFLTLHGCKSCVLLKDAWISDGWVHLVMKKYDTSLADIDISFLNEFHIKYISYQIFSALNYLHSAGIMHRDIKPANVLVDSAESKTVICDFNMSTYIKNDKFSIASYALSSLWYRAPELIEQQPYDERIDIWSGALLLCFLLQGFPLWKHDNESQMLQEIHKCFKEFPEILPPKETKFGEFLRYLMVPLEKRPYAKDVLKHSWFDDVRDIKEIKLEIPLEKFESQNIEWDNVDDLFKIYL